MTIDVHRRWGRFRGVNGQWVRWCWSMQVGAAVHHCDRWAPGDRVPFTRGRWV